MMDTVATLSAEVICDECGKRGRKITRVYHGHKYCPTCYAREFKRRLCPKCGNYARLPRRDITAVCRHCALDQPCIRCGKTDFRVGRVTRSGPVCNSCAKYFREAEACELCGELSRRLTRVSRFNHNLRLCSKCAHADHGNCQACHHPRLLVVTDDGRRLCKVCLDGGMILCQECGQSMPAGRGAQCEPCYWRSLLTKRIAMNLAAFTMPGMAGHFERFGAWLAVTVGDNKAAITVNRYLPFFMEIEKVWQAIPDYSRLVAHFGAEGLRRVRLPMRWMQETGLVVKDVAVQAKDSEKRQIAGMLKALEGDPPGLRVLKGYHDTLMAKVKAGKLSLRSVRLAMAPAKALMLEAQKMGLKKPDQKAVDVYLAKVPGQRAALTGFVRYLREVHSVGVAMPKAKEGAAQKVRQRKLEQEMLAMMREGGEGDEFLRRWVSVGLAYFHGLPRKVGIGADVLRTDGEGMAINVEGKSYWLPSISQMGLSE
ncbi:hypothetical protein HF563_13955 [Acidithiobacillus ferridurans]|nr:hypothetical protein [Acidithiobacillus ferridurans]